MAKRTQKKNNVYEFKRPSPNKRNKQAPKRVIRKRKFRRAAIILAGAVAGITLLIIIIWLNTYKNGQEVYINDMPLNGVIRGLDATAEELLSTAEAKIVNSIGTNILVNEKVTVKPVHAKKSEFVTFDYIVSEIRKNLTYRQEAAIFTVDGIEMATVQSVAIADEIIDKIIKLYDAEEQNIIQREIVEDYSITARYVSSDEIVSIDTAYNILTKSSEVEEKYVIAPGDNLWQIAVNAGLTLEKLMQLNEDKGLTADTPVRIGQEITLVVQKPLLSVKTVEEIKTSTTLKRSVDYMENPSMPTSYKKTVKTGSDGEAVLTEHIVRINGLIEEKITVGEEEITVAPVNDVIEIGTKQ